MILIIGDGMDDQQTTITRNYLKGAYGKLLLDSMCLRSTPHVLDVPIYTLGHLALIKTQED